MAIDSKIEAMIRLRPTMEEATGLVVLLGYDTGDFVEALGDETNLDVLRDLLILLPLQKVDDIKNGRKINDLAQKLVQSRIDKLEEASAK
jgi:hypothetical protein